MIITTVDVVIVTASKIIIAQNLRYIRNIVIHCSAGFSNHEAIQNYFLRPKSKGGRGWNTGGYHIIVDLDGAIHQMYDFNKIMNGVLGYNKDTIHICYVGGVENIGTPQLPIWKGKDTRTEQQKMSIHIAIELATEWLKENGKNLKKDFGVVGHRDYSPDLDGSGVIESWERIKECPSFDAIQQYSALYASKDRKGKLPTEK